MFESVRNKVSKITQ